MIARFAPGMIFERTEEVTPEQGAAQLGSGSLPVYGTPAMVLLLEQTCHRWVEAQLDPGMTSVGAWLQVKHLAPTPLPMQIRIRLTLSAVSGRELRFLAQVWDEVELIGEAEHLRIIVDPVRFLARLDAKRRS